MAWRDSVAVESSRSGLKRKSARIFFIRDFSGCYAILTSPKEGEPNLCFKERLSPKLLI